MNNDFNKVIRIEQRIDDLKKYHVMWAGIGGISGGLSIQAQNDIDDYEMEKQNIINNMKDAEILNRIYQIEILQELRRRAKILKKREFTKEIKAVEEEIKEYVKKMR